MNRVPIAPFSQFLSYYCGPGKICYIVECQLIFLSGICWPGLPLQRFLPGADYASLESLLKNMTRLACRTTPSPPVKFKGNETYLNASMLYSEFMINMTWGFLRSGKCHSSDNKIFSADSFFEFHTFGNWSVLCNQKRELLYSIISTQISSFCEQQNSKATWIFRFQTLFFVQGTVVFRSLTWKVASPNHCTRNFFCHVLMTT